MMQWLLRFLVCVFVIMVVVYVLHLLMGMVPAIPEPMRIILLLIVLVGGLIAVGRYLGMPPRGGGSGDV